MARHGRDPFAPDRRAVDAGNDVDRKALELAMTDSPFDRVDLGPPDRLHAALASLRDRRVQSAAGLETLIGPLRITGEKSAIRTDQRVKASRAAADERIELLEILRQHGDGDHAVERTIADGRRRERTKKGVLRPVNRGVRISLT